MVDGGPSSSFSSSSSACQRCQKGLFGASTSLLLGRCPIHDLPLTQSTIAAPADPHRITPQLAVCRSRTDLRPWLANGDASRSRLTSPRDHGADLSFLGVSTRSTLHVRLQTNSTKSCLRRVIGPVSVNVRSRRCGDRGGSSLSSPSSVCLGHFAAHYQAFTPCTMDYRTAWTFAPPAVDSHFDGVS